jgi:hypothetical protein
MREANDASDELSAMIKWTGGKCDKSTEPVSHRAATWTSVTKVRFTSSQTSALSSYQTGGLLKAFIHVESL